MTGEHGGRPRTTTDLGDHVNDLESLLSEVRACCACGDLLPLGPKPVLQMSATARILIASQAPGTKVHASGVPFSDASGDRLRDRSEEHTSELQSLMRISYADFCLQN